MQINACTLKKQGYTQGTQAFTLTFSRKYSRFSREFPKFSREFINYITNTDTRMANTGAGTASTEMGTASTEMRVANNPCRLRVPLKSKGTRVKALCTSVLNVVV